MTKAILYAILVLSTIVSGCVYEDRDRDHHRDREWREERDSDRGNQVYEEPHGERNEGRY